MMNMTENIWKTTTNERNGKQRQFMNTYEVQHNTMIMYGKEMETTTKDKDRPLSFLQAASFQLINPKAITVILSSVTAYTSTAENVGAEITTLLVVFATVTICATCTWAVFGTAIAHLLTSQTRLRKFNITMALLLIASLLPSILTPAFMN